MKTFSQYKEERQAQLYVESVEEKTASYNEFVDLVLLEMGVGSPVELNAEQYQKYLEKLSSFNPNQVAEKVEEVKDEETVTQPVSEETEETVIAKQFKLSESQLQLVKAIIEELGFEQAKTKLEESFGKLTQFKTVELKENELHVHFNDVSYRFNSVQEAEGFDLSKGKKVNIPIEEGKIKSDAEFKEYAETVLKKAFGDDYDQAKADAVVKGLIDKYKEDYGAMVGALTSGLGS